LSLALLGIQEKEASFAICRKAMVKTAQTESFRAARDFLLTHREDYATAYAGFQWPKLERFN
jgi:hypothetical protein